jgi:hypothetical protein
VIGSRSIGRAGGDGTIFAISILRPSRMAADTVFSAIDPAAMAEVWRRLKIRLKNGIFDSYRPELHYMRGPGPKWHEKHARAQRKAPAPR